MSFFSKISELFYDLFVTEPEEEEYIDSAGEDGKEAGPRMAGALPARAVRPLDAVIFVPRAYSDARRAVDAMEKGLIQKVRNGKSNLYVPLVEKENYIGTVGKNMLDKMFQGSLAKFASSLYDGEKLSSKEVKQLQEFIDRQK